MTTPAEQAGTPALSEINPSVQAKSLAARLLWIQQQKKLIETEEADIKTKLESLYTSNAIPAKDDIQMLFNDGTFHKVRLQRQKTGTYFKVGEDYKDDYSKESHSLQARYLKAGKASMAEKAHTWKVQEVK